AHPVRFSRAGTSATRRCRPGYSSRAFAGLGREKKDVSGESAGSDLEPFGSSGQAVGYEGLAGCDSVDAAYLLNGLFQKRLRAVGPESRKYVERSRYDVCLCKVRDGPQFTQNGIEAASNLQESER